MTIAREIVITGMGVVSPIGIGVDAFWDSLRQGRSGVRRLDLFNGSDLTPALGSEVTDFDPKQYIRPRKSLKVMSRDIQLGFTAADMACQEAGLTSETIDPERFGVVFGGDMITCDLSELHPAFDRCTVDGRFDFSRWGESAMAEMFPLWMLKYLPNMPACHIGIAHDARGPNNSPTLGEVSGLAAVIEAVRVLRRGQADVMIAGGVGSRIQPAIWAYGRVYQFASRVDDPAAAVRPFDADRDGLVHGEGAGALVLETRERAESRGATIVARIGDFAAGFEPCQNGRTPTGSAIRQTIEQVLDRSGLTADQIGHVSANGLSTIADDRVEAQAIHDVLGDVPVTALKSFFGSLGAGSTAVELIAGVLAFRHGQTPYTLNYRRPDPHCPINVIHGEMMPLDKPSVLILSQTRMTQAMALLLLAP